MFVLYHSITLIYIHFSATQRAIIKAKPPIKPMDFVFNTKVHLRAVRLCHVNFLKYFVRYDISLVGSINLIYFPANQ
jgi:hypothetical protein